jgi:hypothetical protein
VNERIRELAEQAGEEAVKSVPFFRTGRCQIPSWVNVFIKVRDKKFAELIVQEVFEMIADEQFEMYPPVVQRVKERFGISDE